uniref:Uncharacterized protein n=1 Tax=Daphnia galeata TaxID=27404 RepID=A0A8J2WKV0_9CRUS|nr:unnamed protein product [Daphnia galeata]
MHTKDDTFQALTSSLSVKLYKTKRRDCLKQYTSSLLKITSLCLLVLLILSHGNMLLRQYTANCYPQQAAHEKARTRKQEADTQDSFLGPRIWKKWTKLKIVPQRASCLDESHVDEQKTPRVPFSEQKETSYILKEKKSTLRILATAASSSAAMEHPIFHRLVNTQTSSN